MSSSSTETLDLISATFHATAEACCAIQDLLANHHVAAAKTGDRSWIPPMIDHLTRICSIPTTAPQVPARYLAVAKIADKTVRASMQEMGHTISMLSEGFGVSDDYLALATRDAVLAWARKFGRGPADAKEVNRVENRVMRSLRIWSERRKYAFLPWTQMLASPNDA